MFAAGASNRLDIGPTTALELDVQDVRFELEADICSCKKRDVRLKVDTVPHWSMSVEVPIATSRRLIRSPHPRVSVAHARRGREQVLSACRVASS